MNREDKARIDALIAIRDYWHSRWTSRRDYSWKATLASWALLAGSPLYIKQRPPNTTLFGSLTIFVAVFAFAWIREIHTRGFTDSRMARHFNSHAEKMLFGETPIYPTLGKI